MSGKHWYQVEADYKTSQYFSLCDRRYVYEASEKDAVDAAMADIARKHGHGRYKLTSIAKAVQEYTNIQFFTWKGELNMSGKLETKLSLSRQYPVAGFHDLNNGQRTVVAIKSRKGEPVSSAYLVISYALSPLPVDLGDSYSITSLGRAWKMVGRVTVPMGSDPKQHVQKIVREEMSKYMREQLDSVSSALNQL